MKRHILHKHNKENVIFNCKICDFEAKVEINLIQHVKRKHERKAVKFECELCDKVYTSQSALKKHKDSVHLQKKVICPDCNKIFSGKACLNLHQRTFHSINVITLLCERCNFKTTYKSSLASPKEKHTQYQCKVSSL